VKKEKGYKGGGGGSSGKGGVRKKQLFRITKKRGPEGGHQKGIMKEGYLTKLHKALRWTSGDFTSGAKKKRRSNATKKYSTGSREGIPSLETQKREHPLCACINEPEALSKSRTDTGKKLVRFEEKRATPDGTREN